MAVQTGTRFSNLIRSKRVVNTASDSFPTNPRTGEFFIDSANNRYYVFDNGAWFYAAMTTTTSTSTSSTSTSTSTTSTSTSSSTTSTSTSTSTTTTL